MVKPLLKFAALLSILAATGYIIRYPAKHLSPHPANVVYAAPQAPEDLTKTDPKDPVYGHPMVIGGVHTIAELGQHKDLYPDLDMSRVREETVKANFWAYVSYRHNGHTFWTTKKRLIVAGTMIFTDGSVFVLERCGNMFREDIPQPYETEYIAFQPNDIYPPDTSELKTLALRPASSLQVGLAPAPIMTPSLPASYPLIGGPVAFGGGGGFPNRPQTPVFSTPLAPTPEPSSLLLLGSGFLGLGLLRRRK